jgi:hypothetical protein
MQDRTSRGSSRPLALKLVASRQTAQGTEFTFLEGQRVLTAHKRANAFCWDADTPDPAIVDVSPGEPTEASKRPTPQAKTVTAAKTTSKRSVQAHKVLRQHARAVEPQSQRELVRVLVHLQHAYHWPRSKA